METRYCMLYAFWNNEMKAGRVGAIAQEGEPARAHALIKELLLLDMYRFTHKTLVHDTYLNHCETLFNRQNLLVFITT